jgi:hypothetical protein
MGGRLTTHTTLGWCVRHHTGLPRSRCRALLFLLPRLNSRVWAGARHACRRHWVPSGPGSAWAR